MSTCINDFTPIIAAVATILTIQVPVLVALFVNQYKIKHDVSVSKALNYTIDRKTDIQTTILSNGFHGDKGDKGEPGKDCSDCGPAADKPL